MMNDSINATLPQDELGACCFGEFMTKRGDKNLTIYNRGSNIEALKLHSKTQTNEAQ